MGLIRRADGDKRVKATKAAAAAVAVAPQRPPPHTRRRRRSRRRRLGAPSHASAARRLRRSHRHRCGLDGIRCHRRGRSARRSVCGVSRGAAERGCGRVARRVRVGGSAARRQKKRIHRWGRRPPPVLAAAMRLPPRRRLEAAAVAHPRRLAGGARLQRLTRDRGRVRWRVRRRTTRNMLRDRRPRGSGRPRGRCRCRNDGAAGWGVTDRVAAVGRWHEARKGRGGGHLAARPASWAGSASPRRKWRGWPFLVAAASHTQPS